jgi:histidine ammonia-lyase
LALLAKPNTRISVSPQAAARVKASHSFVQQYIKTSDKAIYGINTGFGSLCDTIIPPTKLAQLQLNLLMSHACGTGKPVSAETVRLMLALKVHALLKGYSGVSPQVVQRLCDLYNYDILPVVPETGSLGASGDLAPLAHLCLPLVGLGQVDIRGERADAALALETMGWQPLALGPKEGLALLNGTQFMGALAAQAIQTARRLAEWANCIGALSLEAFGCKWEPFHPYLQTIRPQPGQEATAAEVRRWLSGSPNEHALRPHVQDPYSFRCIPQVHGAFCQALTHVADVMLVEVNSVSDNPNVFPDDNLVLSGGNFHGQSIALAMDYLCLAAAQLGGISERRTYQLQSGQRGLPPFLTADPGVNSGLMITQYAAAGILNKLKHKALPVTHDSIPSCNGQEDFVSMGANAGIKLLEALELVQRLLAIELWHGSQAHYLRGTATSPRLMRVLEAFQTSVRPLQSDRLLNPDLTAAIQFLDKRIAEAV